MPRRADSPLPTGHAQRPRLSELSAQRLGEATFWRYGYLAAQGGLSLGLYFALGRALPGNAFPVCATALGVLVIAQTAADFGLAQAAVAVLPNPSTLSRPFKRPDLEAGVALAFLLASAGAMVLCATAALLVASSAALAVLAVAPSAACTLAVAGTDGILRSDGDFRRPVLYVGASRLGSFAGVPVALISGSPTATCATISAGTVVASLPSLLLLLGRQRGGASKSAAVAFVGAAFPLALSNVAVIANARLNTVILGGVSSLRSAAVFESAWRLFQVGQYAIGAAPTAAGPFIADALSGRRQDELRRALRRAAVPIVCGGIAFSAALIAVRMPLDRALFGGLGSPIDRSLLILAPLLPINLLALLMTITLASVSSADRRWVAIAYVVGACLNLAVLLTTVGSDPEAAGAAGAASGIAATALVLFLRMRSVTKNMAGPPISRAVATPARDRP